MSDLPVKVAFSRVFYAVVTVLIVAGFFGVLLITGSVLGAYFAALGMVVCTSNGMIWRAEMVALDAASSSAEDAVGSNE